MKLININTLLFNDNIHDETLDIKSFRINLVQITPMLWIGIEIGTFFVKRSHQNKRKEADFKFWFKSVNRITIVLTEIFN